MSTTGGPGAVGRWNAFLTQITERHAAIRSETQAAAREALRACGYDPVPIANACSGVRDRLLALEMRILETWNEKVEAAFEAEGLDAATCRRARERGARLAFDLETAREQLETAIFAEGAREMWKRALAEQANERTCRTCGATLEVPVTHRAVNLTCAHCRTLSTFEPGTHARMAVAFGAHAIANEAAHGALVAMREAERAAKQARSPTPIELLKAWERAQISYWRAYFTVKGALEPELSDTAREVRARMAAWYHYTAEHEESWRAHGRPVEPI